MTDRKDPSVTRMSNFLSLAFECVLSQSLTCLSVYVRCVVVPKKIRNDILICRVRVGVQHSTKDDFEKATRHLRHGGESYASHLISHSIATIN
jgi:hypothetical protein